MTLPGRREHWRRDPRAGVLVLVAGVGFAGFVALGVALLLAPVFMRADAAVSALIRSIDVPGLEMFARAVTTVGDFWPMAALTAITSGVLWARRRRVEAIMVIVTVLGGALAGAGLKEVFMRLRPGLEVAMIPVPDSYSFPSGHALASFLYFGSLAFVALINVRHLGWAAAIVTGCAVAAFSVALSRVYLGVHYLGDIVGSWLFGFAWLSAVLMVSARWGAGDPAAER